MKRGLIRLFFTTTVVIACIFVAVLLATIFGGIQQIDFDNELVRWLFIILGAFFLVLAIVSLTLIFINEELVKEVILRSDKDGATRTTVGTIKKITKKTTLLLPGVRCTSCNIIENEFGIRLKVTVNVKNKNIDEVDTLLRAMLEDAFAGALSFRFYSIEIRVKKMKPAYVVNMEEITRSVSEQKGSSSDKGKEEKSGEEMDLGVELLEGTNQTDEIISENSIENETVNEEIMEEKETEIGKTDTDNSEITDNTDKGIDITEEQEEETEDRKVSDGETETEPKEENNIMEE